MKNLFNLWADKNYLRMINHPRIHELYRIVDLPTQIEDIKQKDLIKPTEFAQINVAIPA